MANYATLKAAISQVIKENGNKEITGAVMQTTLLAMVDSMASGYTFAGVATPSTSAGTPDENVFWIGGAGSYSNFDASTINVPTGCICIFTYNGSFASSILYVGGVVDISKLTNTSYASLPQALADVPSYLQVAGLEIMYQDSTSNEYVRYELTSLLWSTNEEDWKRNYFESNNTPEYVYLITDKDGKVLFAIKENADILFGYGVPTQIQEYITNAISKVQINIDSLQNIVEELTSIYSSTISVEYVSIITDKDGKIVSARKVDGTLVEFVGVESPTISAINKDIADIKKEIGSDRLNIGEINNVKRLGTPIELMNYNYEYPSGCKDAKYNYLSVLRKTQNIIYLYYGVTDRNAEHFLEDNYLRLAYCDLSDGSITDANNWHRELPAHLDVTPSQKWQAWYNQQTIVPITFVTDAATTRLNIPEADRYEGMFVSYNNGNTTIVQRYGYKTPPEGASWTDTITPQDTRTWNDIFASDDYWVTIKDNYQGNNYPYFDDIYGEPLLGVYGGTTLKVADEEYPYRSFQIARMPLFKGAAVNHIYICMWKSKDGVVFEQCRFVDAIANTTGSTDEQYIKDGTVEAVLCGNVIKLYTRWRPYPFTQRQVGEVDVDWDGNIYAPGHHLLGEDHIYIPAVSKLDERRNILFPTIIHSGFEATAIQCMIIDAEKYYNIPLPDDFSENQTMKQQYVATHGIIPVVEGEEQKQYIIYQAATYAHDLGPHTPNFDYDSNCDYIKIREIKLNNKN